MSDDSFCSQIQNKNGVKKLPLSSVVLQKNGGNFPEIAARTVMEIFASFALALRLTELIQNEELWSEILYVFDTQM